MVRDARIVLAACANRFAAGHTFQLEPPLIDKPPQKLRVMDHLKIPARLWVVAPQTVQTMRAVRYDSANFPARQRRQIVRGQFLKEQLVSHPPRGFAAAAFLPAEHGEANARMLHESYKAPRHPANPPVVTRAQPTQ